MASRQDSDVDDDFSEIYNEYMGPLGSIAPKAEERTTTIKRPHTGSYVEEEIHDPNAVPTDFTSREAKVWEAKSKATERNWKKRKEEEMICKICSESGHFSQGCPSTLGANRKSQDFFERVPSRENRVKALFTDTLVTQIQKEIGCKIKIEEKFIIVSGKDRLILKKGVDAVHKIKQDGEKGSSSSHMARSRTPEQRSSVSSCLASSDSQRSNYSSHSASNFHHRYGRQEKIIGDHVCENFLKISRVSAQAYGSDGPRGRSSHSRSPARHPYLGRSYNSYESNSQSRGTHRSDGWAAERQESDMKCRCNFDYTAFPRTLEEIELEYKREAIELERIRDKEEDEESYKHRGVVREMRENYMKKIASLRRTHVKQWEEFLQLDAQRQQQQAHKHVPASGFGPHNQTDYPRYEKSAGNAPYSEANLHMDYGCRYPNPIKSNPPSRPHDKSGDFELQRRDDFGKCYNRY